MSFLAYTYLLGNGEKVKFLDQRAEVILRDLKKLMIQEKIEITDWEYKKGYYLRPENADGEGAKFEKFNTKKMFFTGKDTNYWFKTKINIPEKYYGKTLWLEVDTKIEGGGCQNPQFLLFVDGKIIQGLDTKHKQTLLYTNTEPKEIRIDLQAHTGYFHTDLKLETNFFLLDEKIQKLYYDIQVPLLSFEWLKEDSLERINLGKHINETINLLDMRNPLSKEFYASLDKAIEYIEKNIYTDMAGNNEIIASSIGHTHIDVAWRWTVEQTKQKVSRSFSTVTKLMSEYDNYKFMSSQPALYKFLKLRYPEIYENVKKLIREKRWEPEGGFFVEADTNLPSGESLIRQMYYGKKFFKDEFGLDNGKILWLPDAFGYSGNLPQIMNKCNIKYFMTTKLAWNQYNKIPNDTFMWEGIDGTSILTYLITTTELKQNRKSFFTTYNGMLHPDAIMGAWNRYQNKNINNDILISYGYGDGGGGPTREMLEVSKRMEKGIKGIPQVKQRFAIDFFEDLEKKVIGNKRLEKWVGELYFEYHRGTLTSMGRNKRANRKTEINLMNLEFLASLSNLEYPQKELDEIWETVLINQFHDILPGSSIKEVYDLTKIQYKEIKEKLNKIQNRTLKSMNTDNKGVTLINTLSHVRNDYVDISNLIGNKSGYLGDNLVQNGMAYIKNLLPKGYKYYEFIESEISNSNIKIENRKFETNLYTLEFDENYNIVSIFDKDEKRELIKHNELANQLIMYEDKPMWHDNWDIDEYYTEKFYEVNNVTKVEVVENGPVYMKLRIERSISRSKIYQDIYLYNDIKRIDFKTKIEWDDSQHLLKVHFPLNIHANTASFDIQFGHIKRATHKNTSWDRARFESAAHKYVDLSEGHYGVAIMNDCKYGHAVNGSNVGLSLIKSGNEPNEMADRETHYITYSLYMHKGDLINSDVIEQSYNINNEIIAYKGKLEKEEYSFISCDKKNIIIETIKKAYDSKDTIIRLYEAHNSFTRFKLNLDKKYKKIYLCDGLENIIKELDINQEIEIRGFEFLTIRLGE